ncbi:MAG: LysR substrate-binding domain-containing protein [Rhodospirillales bacterium]|nr:LysR substrate-binding domain-containing protein [Rhodospirillales bacterium]
MKYTQLRAFHALATKGGFTKAAEFLNVSQPAVTRQIKSLEEDYGIALFHRRGHHLELTNSGQNLYTVSQRIFGLIKEAEDIVSGESELHGGNLRVGADTPFYIMEILAAFKAQYPSMALTVSMESSNDLFQAMRNFNIDVAVVTAVDLKPEFAGISITHLDLVLLVPNDHAWSRRKAILPSMLEGQPIILREPASTTRQLFMQALELAGVSSNVVMELRNQVAVREAVAAGLGLAPELVGRIRKDKSLKRIPFANVPVRYHKYAMCRKDRVNLRKVQAFFEIAKAVAPVIVDR